MPKAVIQIDGSIQCDSIHSVKQSPSAFQSESSIRPATSSDNFCPLHAPFPCVFGYKPVFCYHSLDKIKNISASFTINKTAPAMFSTSINVHTISMSQKNPPHPTVMATIAFPRFLEFPKRGADAGLGRYNREQRAGKPNLGASSCPGALFLIQHLARRTWLGTCFRLL